MSCLFCRIAKKEIASKLVFESPEVYGFYDAHPQAPVHVLFIPKRHIADVQDLSLGDQGLLSALFEGARQTATQLGLDTKGYRLVINSKADGGQTVDHLHVHLLAGRRMGWPPG